MDFTSLGLFLIAAFLGGLTSGLSGFAMGLRRLASSHHAGPERASHRALRIGHARLWHLARAPRDQVEGGVAVHRRERRGRRHRNSLLTTIDQNSVRLTIGVLLIVFSLYNLLRPKIAVPEAGTPVAVGVGVANGVIGGLTGLGASPWRSGVAAWRQQGRTTRHLPAGDVRNLPDERDRIRIRRGVHRRDDDALCLGAACAHRGRWVRYLALRQA